MAICAGALRDYLDRARRPAGPSAAGDGAGVDPHRRRGGAVDQPGVGAGRRPADPPEPTRWSASPRCREAMDEAKRQFELVPAEALVDIQQYSSPVVATAAIRLASRLELADRIDAAGQRHHLQRPRARASRCTCRAPRCAQYIPVSTIAEGMGLNITVHSYLDELEFGLIACRELVPDLWHMVDLHVDEIDVLDATPPSGPSRPADRADADQAPARRKQAGGEGAARRRRRSGRRSEGAAGRAHRRPRARKASAAKRGRASAARRRSRPTIRF